MRPDMAKIVTERPRYGHGRQSKKWGRRLNRAEYELDDHGSNRAPIARRRQYGSAWKEFSDRLGPLRRYLRKQVGRPWDKVWSDMTRTLDRRSLSGQHILDHIQSEVDCEVWIGAGGLLCCNRRWASIQLLEGLYVHPVTGILCHRAVARRSRQGRAFLDLCTTLRAVGIAAATPDEVRRFRVDGLHIWERRECGWFLHTYRSVPAQLQRVLTRSDGSEVSIFSTPHYEHVRTKQASREETQAARWLLEQDPFVARSTP